MSKEGTVQVIRPYATEDELLSHELDTITKASVALLEAEPREPGVVVRFELSLATGSVALRGEGRVIGHKDNVHDGKSALVLRFTRLDTKSKALVDRAGALRESRRASQVSSPEIRIKPEAVPSEAPPASLRVEPIQSEAPTWPKATESAPVSAKAPALGEGPAATNVALERLRARGRALAPERISAVIEEGRAKRKA